ncbi:SET domain-containing protein [Cristinia sonorae]|uniref:SET domain-containing protein n=1 Tax=Cristinia sonorae TaxID=1940300 RepID=A0A8K0USD1_9AGAR|nr:SET domain-containing protein [Cristinia sonorae]
MEHRNSPQASTSQPSIHSASSVTDIEETEEEALCVQDVPPRGKGLVATRKIKRGELLLADKPLLILSPLSSNSTLLVALSRCSREQQQHFFSLPNSFKGRLLPAQGIFESNALLLPGSNSQHENAGVFLLASRFNSSCAPNVSKCWNPALRIMLFRTLRDVQEGEELCFNYCDVLGTREQRREDIMEERNFLCRCTVCELDDEQSKVSDERRKTISRLFDEVAACGREPTLGMRKIKKALRLLQEEHLVHYEASFYYDAFQFCIMVSDFMNAKAWIRRAWEVSCCTSGPDSDVARMFKLYWANPRAHHLAGTLPKTILCGPER